MACTCVAEPETEVEAEALPLSSKSDRKLMLRVRRQWNEAQPVPFPECSKCRWPYHPDDGGWLFRSRCESCETAKLEKMLRRAAKRLGRRRLIRTLKRLAK
jgi:hypothetical protein